MKTAVLVSGGGTNLQALIDAAGRGLIPHGTIALVISSREDAYGLQRAEKAGIPTAAVSLRRFPDREAFEDAVLDAVLASGAELIVLAGCLMIIPPKLIQAFPNRIINIHPSLIPSFCGKGYYGLKVHEKALERGVKVTGATVHFVDELIDNGPILLQKAVEVLADDTPETLQLRVMQQAEWVILPRAVDLIASGLVRVENGKAVILDNSVI